MSRLKLSHQSFTKWSVLGAIGVLVAAGVLSVVGARRLSESTRWVTHTVEVQDTIDQIADHLVEAENNRRGYYLFHDPADLRLMQHSVEAIPKDVAAVRRLTLDNPDQQARLDRLEPLLKKRIQLLERAVDIGQREPDNAVEQASIHAQAQPVTADIRRTLADMSEDEQGLLALRENTLHQTNIFTITVVIGAGILAIVLFSLASFFNQREITQRVAIEKEMRRQRAMLRSVLNSMGEGVAVVDDAANFTLFNPAAERLLGIHANERSPKEWSAHFHAFQTDQKTPFPVEDLPLYKVLRDRVAEPAEIWVMDPKSPEGAWIRVTARPLEFEDGSIRGGVAVFANVSQQKLAESALRHAQDNLESLLAESKRRERESSLLNQLAELLQSCRTPEESYSFIEHGLQLLFPEISGAVSLTSSSRNIVETVISWGSVATEYNFSPEECWALRRGRIHRSNEEASVLRCPHLLRSAHDRALCIPLVAQGEALGVICLNAPAEVIQRQCPTPADVEARLSLAARAGEQVSLALANLQLRETLRNQSIRDSLTGLYNRRYMEESLARELHRAKRRKTSIAILMIDVDHFKRFNDTMGHETGDQLLRKFGEFLRSNIRADDIACRYGGEEFALILPDSGLDGGMLRAEALREGAAALSLDSGIRPAMHITISCGVSIYPENGASGEELLRTADAALYQAKSSGRNQVAVARTFQPAL